VERNDKPRQPGGQQEVLALVRDVKDYTEYLMNCGFRDVVCPQAPQEDVGPKLPWKNLAEVERDAKGCAKCRLSLSRTQVVFGVGNPHAQLMFVGEAPGRDEDLQGEPFVGRAGQLLTRIIEAIGLRREEVYITNIIKSRPPGNRSPRPDEIAACAPYLEAQIALIRPRVICALGNVAAQALLNTDEKISALRGRFHSYRGILVMPTYHPAYLLRNPNEKRAVWEDMKLVQELLRQAQSSGDAPVPSDLSRA